MKFRALAFLAVAATTACSSSKSSDPPSATGSATPPQAVAAAPPAAPTPAPAADDNPPTVDGTFDCAKLLPDAMVQRHYPKAKVTTALDNLCDVAVGELGDPGSIDFNIEYRCNIPIASADIADVLKMAGGTPVAGLGRGASQDKLQLRAFDDDTSCVLTVSYLDTIPKLADFVKDALATVTPALLRSAVTAPPHAP